MRIRRLRERASRSTALPTVPPNSFLEVRPSMLPLYHITQPAKDRSTRRAPEYTNRSPKSRPWISRGAKTPSSRDMTPSRSISTANTRASLQWDRPSYLVAMAAHESIRGHIRKWSDRTSEIQSSTLGDLTWLMSSVWSATPAVRFYMFKKENTHKERNKAGHGTCLHALTISSSFFRVWRVETWSNRLRVFRFSSWSHRARLKLDTCAPVWPVPPVLQPDCGKACQYCDGKTFFYYIYI